MRPFAVCFSMRFARILAAGFRSLCAQVYKALLDGVTAVAIKRLHNSLDARQRQLFLREIATLRDIHSPYIVQFLGACLQPSHTMLVTEWMDLSLWDAMANNRSHGLPTDTLGWYARYAMTIMLT